MFMNSILLRFISRVAEVSAHLFGKSGQLCLHTYPRWLKWKGRRTAAQDCNDDVLSEILSYLDTPEAAHTSLVCRRWLHASRKRLYTAVYIELTKEEGRSLSVALGKSSLLRSYLRRLEIVYGDDWISLRDWLPLLAPGDVWNLDVTDYWDQREFELLILKSPMARSVRHLVLRGDFFKSDTAYFSFPHVERLILLRGFKWGHFSLVDLPSLKWLSIQTHFYAPEITSLLVSFGPSLERFDLCLAELETDELPPVLKLIGGGLRRMSLHVAANACGPFLDDIVTYLPNLEHLRCPFNTYTASLFDRIPPTIKSLELEHSCHPDMEPLHIDKLVALVERARKGDVGLRHLRITRYLDNTDRYGDVAELEDASQSAGVDFTWQSEEEAVYY